MTATEASRNFSDLLDAIERGETVTITRGHHAVAEVRPARSVPERTFGLRLSRSLRLMTGSLMTSRMHWR